MRSMPRLTLSALALCALIVVSACGGGPSATGTPSAGGSSATASQAPSVSPSGGADPSGSPIGSIPSVAPSTSDPASPAPSGDPTGEPTGDPTTGPSDPPATGFDPRRVQLALEEVVTGLDSPVAVTHAGDGSGTEQPPLVGAGGLAVSGAATALAAPETAGTTVQGDAAID